MSNSLEQIRHLMNEYCYRIDAGDLKGFAELFAHGSWGVEGDPSGPCEGSEAVLEILQNVTLYDGLPLTKHVMSNVEINIDTSGTSASSQAYITVFQAVPPEFPLQPIFIGHYHNQFEQNDGKWHFSSMRIAPDLVGDLRYHRKDMADA